MTPYSELPFDVRDSKNPSLVWKYKYAEKAIGNRKIRRSKFSGVNNLMMLQLLYMEYKICQETPLT